MKLVEIAGRKVIRGGNNLADGKVSAEGKKAALKRVKQQDSATRACPPWSTTNADNPFSPCTK